MTLSKPEILKLRPGDALPKVVRQLTQDKVNRYAEAVGDFNPIHVDETFAAHTAFGGTVAHGMLILAYVSEMMTLAFGESWFSTGKLSVRFKGAAHSTDTITVNGKVNSVETESDGVKFTCQVECCSQRQETVIMGKTEVKVTPE